MRSKWMWAALALAAVLGITTAASATTRGLITGKQIAPHSINSKHLVNHTIQAHDLSQGLMKSLHGAKGATGPAGPQGLKGDTGPQGPIGPQGPSGNTKAVERYLYSPLTQPATWLPIVSGAWPNVDPTHVLTIHLDKGNWAVSAKVIASNYTGQGIVVCILGYGDISTVGQSGVGNAGGFALQQTFGMQTIFPLSAPTDLELSCFNAPPSNPVGNPNIGYADIVATQVNTVDVNGGPRATG